MRLLIILFLAAWIAPLHAGESPPKVVLRIYVQSPGAGQSPMEVMMVHVPPDNEEIQIRALPEVTEADLSDVQRDATGAIHLFFDHVGTVNLDATTAQNQGRILVVTIDGYVVYAPMIDQEIPSGELVIPHPLTPLIVQLLKETAERNMKKSKSL